MQPDRRLIYITVTVFCGVLLLLSSPPVQAAKHPSSWELPGSKAAVEGLENEWMEVFLGPTKVGYSFTSIRPIKAGFHIKEELLLSLRLMGVVRNVHTITDTIVDRRFLIRKFRYEIVSGLVSFRLSGEVKGNWLVVERGYGDKKVKRQIRLKSHPLSSAAIPLLLKERKLAIGESFRVTTFDPSTLAVIELPMTAKAKEQIGISGRVYETVKYESEIMGHRVFFWLGTSGELIKQSGMMGLTLVRSDAAHAPLGIGKGQGKELYDMVAVVPDRPIEEPRRVTLLKLRLKGIKTGEIRLAPHDMRQTLHGDILTVKKESLPDKNREEIHLRPELKRKALVFLRPGMNIESNDERIKQKAREITRGARGPLARARKLLSWVYTHVEKKPVIGIPSALETLKSLEGDCNEHSVLLAALLRASGIPARVCVGLVYARDKFYYHAWNEAFLGGQWVSMDATLNQIPTDATHIKFAQGGLDKQMEIMRVMGRLKLEVLEQEASWK